MGAVKHAVRVVDVGGFVVPVRRQPPLVVGYEHFRLEGQGALLSPKDADLLRRDGPAVPALAGGGRREALRRGRRRAGWHLSRAPGDEAGKVGPAAGAQDDPGVAPGDPLLPAVGAQGGLRGRWAHPRVECATGARQGADGGPHRPAPPDLRRLHQPSRPRIWLCGSWSAQAFAAKSSAAWLSSDRMRCRTL